MDHPEKFEEISTASKAIFSKISAKILHISILAVTFAAHFKKKSILP